MLNKLTPILIMSMFALFACTTINPQQKTANDAYQFLVLSNVEYDNIMTQAASMDLTEDQKESLMGKANKYYNKHTSMNKALLDYKKKLDAGQLTEIESIRLERSVESVEAAFNEFIEYAESLGVY